MTKPCPVCECADVEIFLERGGVPVFQNLPFATAEEARAIPRGTLRLGVCRACGFVTNEAFDAALITYSPGYENDQTHSGLFGKHVDGLLKKLGQLELKDKVVVEVGCGQGAFLKQLCAETGARGLGFDPAHVGPERQGNPSFVRAYYGPQFRDEQADVVVCRHVIEHVPDPVQLLRAIRATLGNDSKARVFFETPDVGWILRNFVAQDFFYEHCSYFTPETLTRAFDAAGFAVSVIETIFQEQYLWLEASPRPGGEATLAAPTSAPSMVAAARAYGETVRQRIAHLEEVLVTRGSAGNVAVWGGGAKGTTFANLIDPDRTKLDCVVDINPRKQGRFVPGSGHPIVGPDDLGKRGIGTLIVMNPNYLAEIQAEVSRLGLQTLVILENEA